MDTTAVGPTKRSLRSSHAHNDDGVSGPKKRKIRKGTHSCWECRRRKMKCIFRSPADSVCISCHRRGAECVGQQFPEVISTSLDRSLQIGDRVVRVEALVENILQRAPGQSVGVSCDRPSDTVKDGGSCSHSILTPAPITAPTNSASPQSTGSCEPPAASNRGTETVQYAILDDQGIDGLAKTRFAKSRLAGPGDHGVLSGVLHESLPTPKDIEIIAGARGRISTRFFEMTTTTYNDLGRAGPKPLASLLKTPGPDVHPVLIARHMLWVATFLQHLHPHLHDETTGLSEPPRQMMKRLADTCIRLVTTNDDLVASFEGLECVMIESLYHTNGGNLRKGLIAIRRAIVIAQLMGFHRPGNQTPQCHRLDPETQPNPGFIWYRILFSERHLCLMLGLPQSTLDHSMASEAVLATDSPMGRLERIHCTIASRILERNQSDPNPNDTALTEGLDGELQKAAENLPRKWWLAANLATASEPEALFWDMRRLFHQLFHYNLLNQLHLPYMLRSNYTGDGNDYSRMTCVNASREVLSRFMMFQSIDRIAFWCRTMYFFSLMAAMTLIMAHLDGHRRRAGVVPGFSQQQQHQDGRQGRKTENLLTHQRPGDRAMVEQVQESMEQMSRLKEDELGAQSAELLRRLLVIEAEAAVEAAGRAQLGGDAIMQGPTYGENQAAELERDETGAVRFRIPHFGAIKIGRDGVISKDMTRGEPSSACTVNQIKRRSASDTGAMGSKENRVQTTACSLGFENRAGDSKTIDTVPLGLVYNQDGGTSAGTKAPRGEFSSQSLTAGENSADTDYGSSGSSKRNEVSLQQDRRPQTAGVDEWALQGVDMAFFDSLMREIGDGVNERPEWLADMAM